MFQFIYTIFCGLNINFNNILSFLIITIIPFLKLFMIKTQKDIRVFPVIITIAV